MNDDGGLKRVVKISLMHKTQIDCLFCTHIVMSARAVFSNLTNVQKLDENSNFVKPNNATSMEMSLHKTEEDASLDTITLAEKLSSYGSEYITSSTRMMFLERVMAGKKAALAPVDLNMESTAQSRFLDIVESLQREAEEYELAFNELEFAKNAYNESSKQKPMHTLSGSNAFISAELKQSEDILSKLKEQRIKMDNIIAEKRVKREQAKVSLELSLEEAMKNSTTAVQAIGGKFRIKNSAEEKQFAAAIKKVQDQRDNAEALLEGLRVLTGIQSVRVPNDMVRVHSNRLSSNNFNSAKSVKDQFVLPMTVEIEDITAVLTLDESMRLSSIDVTSGELELDGRDFNREKRQSVGVCSNTTSEMLSEIMDEARTLSIPQDLRYAVFALGCVQKSPSILRAHVSELRKKCIVRSTGLLSAEFTLSAGVTISLTVHHCYPCVPAGVTADSIVGVGGWTVVEIEMIRNAANAQCFSTIMDMFEYFLSADAFGR